MTEPRRGAALELRGVSKTYGDQTVVERAVLDAQPGEFITLLGPSGSGKTTTLNMIAGFVDVSEGEIFLDQKPISDLPPHRRDIGVVFQHYALFPHMTAWKNVAFPLKQRKFPRAEIAERVERALSSVGLEGFDQRYPRQLSGGQQQRVALARAIVFGPRLLLMDEPLGALDRNLRERLQLEIKRLHRELGITFFYVTHDQEEALVLSDRIAVFLDGRIEQVGTPADLYEQPATQFVAEFIGESNTFHGQLESDGAGAAIVVNDGHQMLVSPADGLPIGSRVVAVLRPERLRLNAEPAPGENSWRGVVDQVIYLGAERKLQVRVEGISQVLALRQPSSTCPEVVAGSEVTVAWSPEDAVVLPEQSATALAAKQGAETQDPLA
jgi:putative spermidine/putrescine transport system ATP-binding protein